MKNIKMLISYEGTHFLGWQKTRSGRSVEQSLQEALETILQQEITLQAASRTDAGVHATGQVANFFMQNETIFLDDLLYRLNCLVPKDITIESLEHVHDDFHPTLDNTGKLYHYFVSTKAVQDPFGASTSWHQPFPLCLDSIRNGAAGLIGTKDFAGFCNDLPRYTRSTICSLQSVDITEMADGKVCIAISGDRFLYKMVRNIVGALVYIGRGKMPIYAIENILSTRMRKEGAITAPAQGLFLKKVYYKEHNIEKLC